MDDQKKPYLTSFNIMEYDDAEIEVIENCTPENRYEREGYWIRYYKNLGECCNNNIPGRNARQYYEDNRRICINRVKDYQRRTNYYENNKERIRERYENKRYRLTCDCGARIWSSSLQSHERTKKHRDFQPMLNASI